MIFSLKVRNLWLCGVTVTSLSKLRSATISTQIDHCIVGPVQPCSLFANLLFSFFILFCVAGGGFTLCPEIVQYSTEYTVTLPVLRVLYSERCRIRIRDHCISSLERYQCTTTFHFLSFHFALLTFPWRKSSELEICSYFLHFFPTGPNGNRCPTQIKMNPDGTFTCEFSTNLVGEHTIEIIIR